MGIQHSSLPVVSVRAASFPESVFRCLGHDRQTEGDHTYSLTPCGPFQEHDKRQPGPDILHHFPSHLNGQNLQR